MKRYLLFFALSFMALSAMAQNDDWAFDFDEWVDQSDFDAFKKADNEKFDAYRDSINRDFARALEGKWSPFKTNPPKERPQKPDPKEPPIAPERGPMSKPVDLELMPSNPVLPAPEPPAPEKRHIPLPKPPAMSQTMDVPFYGSNVRVELPLKNEMDKCYLAGTDERSVANFWRSLTNSDFQSTVNILVNAQRSMRLNDWAMYDMTVCLTKKVFPGNNDAQAVATVFLLNQMEYDARICRTNKGLACMLAIRDIMVYDIPYLTMGGRNYFLFMPNGAQKTIDGNICTYNVNFAHATIPVNISLARSPRIPRAAAQRTYNRTVSGRTVNITANQNLLDFYKGYPQVDMQVYANAAVDSATSASLLRQFRPMVEGKSKKDAVATLLHHLQYCFDYATDDDQFGYEKPFFDEENFYYPKNDCEDRAILLSWLVRKLLGMDVVLLHYPNHLSMAVCFPEGGVSGTYVTIDGKRYVECDPTYIGASIGMTQPSYRGVAPEVIRVARY